ncbi:MAG: histidine phosphatase family protein [Thermoactinospora sp.]|nr:histidine phosphatase family protein [Thermoactinospora sp.]
MNEMLLLRHGETEWSKNGRHTGRTDLPLTSNGESQAKLLAPVARAHDFALVLVSPAARARRTADLAGLTGYEVEPDLWEWDYGDYEGITTPVIRESRPGWYLWDDGVPNGESADDVGARADRVIARVKDVEGDVAVVAHGHFLRVFTARWLGLPAADGRLFRLDTGTYSRLGHEHAREVVLTWNAPVTS